jgi:hypothetical protein
LIDADAEVSIRRLEVNKVPDDLFRFAPPPGTLVQNRDTREVSQVPGGLSFLDDVVATARRDAEGTPAGTQTPWWKSSALFGAVALLGVALAWELCMLARAFTRTRLTPSSKP